MTSHASPAAAAGPSLSPLQAAPPSSSSVQPVAVDASGLTPCHPAGAPWGTPSVTGPPPSPGLKPKAQTPGAFVSHSRSITRSAAVTLGLHCPSPWHVVAAQSSGTELVRLAPCGWRGSDGHGLTLRAAAGCRVTSLKLGRGVRKRGSHHPCENGVSQPAWHRPWDDGHRVWRVRRGPWRGARGSRFRGLGGSVLQVGRGRARRGQTEVLAAREQRPFSSRPV